jgi:cytochrome c-type biogenesis protein
LIVLIVSFGLARTLDLAGGDMSGVTQLVTSGPLILALPVAAAAGAVTFLSPCCLPLVPGYLSFVTGMAGADSSPPATAVDTPGDAPGLRIRTGPEGPG